MSIVYCSASKADYCFQKKRKLPKENIKREKRQFNQEPSKMKNRKTQARHISLALSNLTEPKNYPSIRDLTPLKKTTFSFLISGTH